MSHRRKAAFIALTNDRIFLNLFWKHLYTPRDILKERLLAIPIGFSFRKNHYLYQIIDENVQHLVSGGIVDHLYKFHERDCLTPYEYVEWEPYVFSLDDLLFGFFIWLAAYGVCLGVVALECALFYGKRVVLQMIGSTIGLYFMIIRFKRGFRA
jgi:hypothetical protein